MAEFNIKNPEINKMLSELTDDGRQKVADLIETDLNEMSPLKKIENLSKSAWEQVDKNPEEAKELFKMIYELAKE